MYVMNWNISIGRYRLRTIESVKICRSVETLSDTAEIVLPATVFNTAVEIEEKLNVGDVVQIRLGYDDSLETEFKGYLKGVKTDGGSLTLECEDELYLWDVPVSDEEFSGIRLSDLLKRISAQVNKEYLIDCGFEFSYETFRTFRATGRDVLKKVQEETKANVYFKDKTLYIKPQYADGAMATVFFDFARNIESADLKYKKASDKKVEVKVTMTLPDGRQVSDTFGQSGGKTVQIMAAAIDRSSMKKIAENEYNLWCYDGYEGGFTGWLAPYVEPGDAVRLHDGEYEYKSGRYYVVATEVSFSRNGGKRTVSLGRRLQ